MNSPSIQFRPNRVMGLGHIMRSATVEFAWKSMFGDTIVADGYAEIVVVDDYTVTNEQRAKLMLDSFVVSYTEFNHEHLADIAVNQNLGANTYGARKNLNGPRYYAIRREYLGMPVSNDGGVFDADAEKRGLTPYEFSRKMARASAVVTATGLAAYEALYLGKPLLLRCIADNQQLSYDNLISQEYALPAEPKYIHQAERGLLPPLRSGKTLVDGLGAARVAREIFVQWREACGR